MRTVVAILACLGVGAISLALADPSTTAPGASAAPPSAATPAPTAAAPAAAAPAAAASSAPALDPREKQLLAKGYKMQMHDGQRVFCRREEELGSRVQGRLVCATVEQLTRAELDAKENLQQAQRQMNPGSK